MISNPRRSFKNGLAVPITVLMLAVVGCAKQADHSQLTADTRAIIGGIPVDENSEISASAVLVIARQAPKAGSEICTGTLISKNLVLTAAHCVLRGDDPTSPIPPTQVELYFGNAQVNYIDHKRSVINDRARKEAFKVVFHEKHVGHNQDSDINDIALIQFQGDLPQGLKPASVLPASQSEVPLQYRTEVEVAGFGITQSGEALRQLNLRQTSLISVADDGDSIIRLATSQFEDRGTCNGDSGGPSYVYIDDIPYLWAVSIQSNCRNASWVLNLADFHGWIKKKAAELEVESPKFD